MLSRPINWKIYNTVIASIVYSVSLQKCRISFHVYLLRRIIMLYYRHLLVVSETKCYTLVIQNVLF